MSARSLLVLVLSLLSLTARAELPLRHLPPPLAKGGYAGYLVPAPLSGPLGFHVRGTLLAAPGEQDLAIGGQVGLSMSFIYGEAGASFYGAALLARDAAPVQRRGPIEVWMRLGPFYPVGKDRSGLVLAAFGEYAVARAEVDAGGTMIPETTTLGLIAGWHKGWTEAHLSGAYQRGVGVEGETYHGAQLGGAIWLRFFHALQAGAEALVRSGCFAGTATCRPGAMGLIGLRALDRHGVGGGLAAGLGYGEDMPAWMVMARFGFTVGEGFKPPPRETDLEADIRDWLAARARRRAEEAQQLAQRQQEQLAQAAAQRQALAQALAQRYPLGSGTPPQQPPDLVSPVCVRRPCGVAGWRFDQAVDQAVNAAWSKPEVTGPPPRDPGRGIAQVPPWRPPPRPPGRPPRTGQPGRGSPLDAREPYEDRESGERETARRAQERERERVWGSPETPWPSRPPAPYPTMRPDPRGEAAETAEPAPQRVWYQGGAEAEAAAQHTRPGQAVSSNAAPAVPTSQAGPAQPARRGHVPRAIKEVVQNKARGADGGIYCTDCDTKTTRPTRRTKGSTVAPTEMQYDHVYPWSKGGPTSEENLEIRCATCNRTKSDKVGPRWNNTIPPKPTRP